MKRHYSLFALLAAFMILISAPALANSPKLIGQYKQWSAYHYEENGGKVCFMASSPISAKGNYTRRGDIFSLITHRTNNDKKNVVSFIAGYPYKDDSEVSVTIDGRKKFTLFTDKDTAWAKDSATDNTLTQAIKDGNRMVVKGRSSRGTLTTDTYSLAGSTAAHKAISRACR